MDFGKVEHAISDIKAEIWSLKTDLTNMEDFLYWLKRGELEKARRYYPEWYETFVNEQESE